MNEIKQKSSLFFNIILMKTDIWSFKTQGQLYHKHRPNYPHQLCSDALKPLSQKKKYLDIGVGTGKALFQFCGNFEESKGIDVSDAMLDIAKKHAQDFMKQSPNNKVSIQKMGVQDLEIDAQKYDLITAGQSLFYFPGEKPLKTIRNCLKKDGIFVALNYHLAGMQDFHDDVCFQEFWSKITKYMAFDHDDLANHFSNSEKYPLEGVFDKVERKYAKVYVEMTKQQFIMAMKTYAGCNICQAKTGIDPTIILSEGLKSQRITFRYEFSRITCYKLTDD